MKAHELRYRKVMTCPSLCKSVWRARTELNW